MSLSFLPTWTANAVTDVTPEFLHRHGIHLLMLDFDNTIVPYTTSTPTEPMAAWLRTMAASDIRLCVVSNSHKNRVKIFCSQFGIDCITHANKPFPKGIRQCLETFRMDPACGVLVGDQIFTDTLGGNCAGIRTILVKPIDNHNFWLKARHVLEKPFIFMARKRKMTI